MGDGTDADEWLNVSQLSLLTFFIFLPLTLDKNTQKRLQPFWKGRWMVLFISFPRKKNFKTYSNCFLSRQSALNFKTCYQKKKKKKSVVSKQKISVVSKQKCIDYIGK